jgi:hypothetical protein
MTDYVDLAIENGAIEIANVDQWCYFYKFNAEQLNATIEAAIQKAFDDAEVVGYAVKEPSTNDYYFSFDKPNNSLFEFRPLIAKRV